ncbi:MAG: hypothetical protein JNK72_09800 [Myxococcales bacterium]|nr:hypothetical protein [Myxococcales bacterium]
MAVGLSMGVAGAQTPQNNPSQGNAEIGNRQTANLSGADQLRESTTVVETIGATRRRVSDMLDRARQERDIIKVNCLNDKLTQVDVTLRSARDHQELLQTAVSIANDGARNHEFTLINIYRSRVESLEGEARQCIGEEATAFDRTVVSLQVSREIATTDTTTLPVDSLAPERPLVTSPAL